MQISQALSAGRLICQGQCPEICIFQSRLSPLPIILMQMVFWPQFRKDCSATKISFLQIGQHLPWQGQVCPKAPYNTNWAVRMIPLPLSWLLWQHEFQQNQKQSMELVIQILSSLKDELRTPKFCPVPDDTLLECSEICPEKD